MSGGMPKWIAVAVVSTAISASCSLEGFSITPQSAKAKTSLPRTMKNRLETREQPRLHLMICRAGIIVLRVEWVAPQTRQSASPL